VVCGRVEGRGREKFYVYLGKRLGWDNRSERQQEGKRGRRSKLLQKQPRKTRNMGALVDQSPCCVKDRDLHTSDFPCTVCSACLVLLAAFLFGLLFNSDDGGSKFPQIIGISPNYMVLQPRRHVSHSHCCENLKSDMVITSFPQGKTFYIQLYTDFVCVCVFVCVLSCMCVLTKCPQLCNCSCILT
jgi:hypothetical protein